MTRSKGQKKGQFVHVQNHLQLRPVLIAHIDDGDFAVVAVAGGFDLELGAKISGDLEALGHEVLLDLQRGERFEAVGESGPSGYDV